MSVLMMILQISSAVLMFLNKVFVFQKKPVGWMLGIIGTIILTLYFLLQMWFEHKMNLWILVVMDGSLVVLMTYGYVISRNKENKAGVFLN